MSMLLGSLAIVPVWLRDKHLRMKITLTEDDKIADIKAKRAALLSHAKNLCERGVPFIVEDENGERSSGRKWTNACQD